MSQVIASRFKKGRSKCVTQASIDRRIAAGDGQGSKEEYVPWIKVRSMPSRGTSQIVPGVKIFRTHHFLSKAEYHYFLILENDESVIDIREQFPLFPASETSAIATSQGIKAPVFVGTNIPLVMTSDFLVTRLDKDGGSRLVARTLKYAEEIESAPQSKRDRLLEKLHIEREYWERRGVEWKLVLYERLSQNKINNLIFLRSYARISPDIASDKNIRQLVELVSISDFSIAPLKAVLGKMSRVLFMDYMSVKRLFFHLVWLGVIKINLEGQLINLLDTLFIEKTETGISQMSRIANA